MSLCVSSVMTRWWIAPARVTRSGCAASGIASASARAAAPIALCAFIARQYNRAFMIRVEQAGGVAFRREDGMTTVLLVRSKKNPTIWVFPKGHIERGETAEDAALRETYEEGGVRGDPVGPVGKPLEFESGRELVRVQYFLIRATDDEPSPEGREKGWFSLADANERLLFETARALLQEAASLYGR